MLPVRRGAPPTRTRMNGLKRYIRPGLVLSVIGHLAALTTGLFLVGASALHTPPPEAMVVEVVTSDEMPRFEGMHSNLHSSGSETPSPANGKGPVTQAPPPQPRPQQQQQSQQNPTQQREAKEAPAPHPPEPEATQAELVRAEKTEPEKQDQPSEQEPAASPPAEQRPEQPKIAEEVAQYLADGGPLGGGFAAPPVDTSVLGYDWTLQFRERLGTCSRVPAWVEPGQGQHKDPHFLQPGRHAGVSTALARAGPISETTGVDGQRRRRFGKMSALHHAAARKIQAVEDDGALCHPDCSRTGEARRGRVPAILRQALLDQGPHVGERFQG